MKILQVIPYFHWMFGGPVRVVYEVSRELAMRGHSVTIYTTDVGQGNSLRSDQLIKFYDNVEIYYFKCANNWLANNMKAHISNDMRLAIRDNLEDFDIVHLQECRGVPNLYAWYYAKKYNKPYVIQCHGATHSRIVGQSSGIFIAKLLFDRVFEKRILHEASKVLALTLEEKEQYKLMGMNGTKIEILPNGLDLSQYQNLPERNECRKLHGFAIDEKLILYVGRLNKSKGVDLLIKAFAKLHHSMDNIRLVLVGPDDGNKSELNELVRILNIEDRVCFTGFLTDEEKIALYICADVFVTPNFSGFPVTFLEACACGTPLVTTNMGDYLDWIDDQVGYLVEYDETSISNAIHKILSAHELQDRFGREGKRLVQEKFNWRTIVDKLECVYIDSMI